MGFPRRLLLDVELRHFTLPAHDVTGLCEPATGLLAFPGDPSERRMIDVSRAVLPPLAILKRRVA